MERVKGVEPSSLAWKARVIAVIRHPRPESVDISTDFHFSHDFFASTTLSLLYLPTFYLSLNEWRSLVKAFLTLCDERDEIAPRLEALS